MTTDPAVPDVRLEQIRERAEKATPGPWDVDGNLVANTAFIAAAREDVPWLLDRLREARDENERLWQGLLNCATISGADVSDGAPTWPSIDVWAVAEVRELRESYDECPSPEDLTASNAELVVAREALARVERLIDPAAEFAAVNDGRQRLFDESDIRAALAGQEGAS